MHINTLTKTKLASATAHNLQLRDYQYELAETSLQGRNNIVCAETGTGKTWVALHIVDKHLNTVASSTLKSKFQFL